jgi:putative addiction module antidote
MVALKVTRIGNALGVILPNEALARLKVEEGGSLLLTEAPDGYRITPHDEAMTTQMAEARRIMGKRRHALRELAK